MIYANILLTVKDAKDVPEIRDLLREQGLLSRAEPGCARFEVYQSNVDETRFFLIERWESNEALDLHRKARPTPKSISPRCFPRSNARGMFRRSSSKESHECEPLKLSRNYRVAGTRRSLKPALYV